jgi:hypothetical protein
MKKMFLSVTVTLAMGLFAVTSSLAVEADDILGSWVNAGDSPTLTSNSSVHPASAPSAPAA